ncbi:DNA primase TraC (plasmid) [Variovorax sp. SRS16]|uniref:zincin-like metallopeptidase domain-containing protein n=1 Tax=Variovorax sp. SRS16 TaxID=282217 RepID=UPI0013175AB8|nr:zincin-like metallopeptidase domain-containing protein [Variovorax sp. SRS16]VTU46125.1 DNA primase TraC [Variovorax sp. SRS16]
MVKAKAAKAAKEPRKPFHELVADKLIEQLRQGTAPWQRPWVPGEPSAFIPMNPTTGKRYRGINAVFLMAQGRDDPRWLTFKQAIAIGAQVRKGEHGTPIQYWKFAEEQQKVDGQGRPIVDANGQPVMQRVELERPRVFFATVFNAQQIDGMPPMERKPAEQTWSAQERAEAILDASGAVIRHGEHDRAFYRPSTDSIHLPDRAQFPTADNYYATALHELGHWSGHASRLNRDLANPFGSVAYAKEELRAEIASMILGDELGIGHDPEQHAAYVKAWIQVLQDDPMEIVRAAADAEKIQDFVLGFEQTQSQQQATAQDESQRPTVVELTATQYQTMKAADTVLHQELLRAYGEAKAGDARYQLTHEDGAVQQAAEDFRAATGAWHEAVTAARKTVDGYKAITPQAVRTHAPEDLADTRSLPVVDGQPGRLVDKLEWSGVMSRADAVLASAWRDLHAGTDATRSIDVQALHEASQKAFGFDLPDRWNGHLEVQPMVRVEVDDRWALVAPTMGQISNAWVVVAALESGATAVLQPCDTQAQAQKVVDRLKLIDAYAEMNHQMRDSKMQRIREDWLRNDPPSTDPEKSAARQARKLSEAAALRSDSLQQEVSEAPARDFINVPFKERNEAKALGAKWDRAEQSWYVPASVDLTAFSKWEKGLASTAVVGSASAQAAGADPERKSANKRQYLAVPYGERELAKQAGALWDRAVKSWYAGANADPEMLARWAPEKVLAEQSPALDPRTEFTEALVALGFVVEGEHPIMDGRTHRAPVEGDKRSEASGFYVGHLDGHPAGYIRNNRSSIEVKWKSKGYTLDPAQKAAMQAEAGAKLEARAAAQAQLHEATAQRIAGKLQDLKPVDNPTPYLAAKGIRPHPGAFTDGDGKTTLIPAIDTDNRIWTMQYIQEDGTKRFAKNSRKDGCFHAVGGLDALANAPVIVIAEGYATAATLSEVLGHATVAAFDAGNLPAVALALRDRFPDKPFVIAGDNDQHQEFTLGVNAGRSKAEAAAAAVGGKAMFPIFAPGESTYPADLPVVTPKHFRAHSIANGELEKADADGVQLSDARREELTAQLLSGAQLGAIARMKKHTDFNDLANNSLFGREGVERQARAVVESAVAKHAAGVSQQEEQRLVQAREKRQGQTLDTDAPEPRKRRATVKM